MPACQDVGDIAVVATRMIGIAMGPMIDPTSGGNMPFIPLSTYLTAPKLQAFNWDL